MPKALDYSWELPYTPEALFEQGKRLDYIEAQAKTVGHYDAKLIKLDDTPEGGGAQAEYYVEASGVPSWAKKMVPPRAKVTETRVWPAPAEDGSRSYEFWVKIEGIPVDIKGTVLLKAIEGGKTQNDVHIVLKANLPIIGAKLEEFVADDLEKTVLGERDFSLSWMKSL